MGGVVSNKSKKDEKDGGAPLPETPSESTCEEPSTFNIHRASTMQTTALQVAKAMKIEDSTSILHRSVEGEQVYQDSKKEGRDYEKWWQRVYVNEFDVPVEQLPNGKWTIKEKPSDDEWRLSINPYPYDWPPNYEHWCLWSPTEKSPEFVVEKLFKQFQEHSYVVWENPAAAKSIPAIWHVQLVVKPEPREQKRGLRLYIDGHGKHFQKASSEPLTHLPADSPARLKHETTLSRIETDFEDEEDSSDFERHSISKSILSKTETASVQSFGGECFDDAVFD